MCGSDTYLAEARSRLCELLINYIRMPIRDGLYTMVGEVNKVLMKFIPSASQEVRNKVFDFIASPMSLRDSCFPLLLELAPSASEEAYGRLLKSLVRFGQRGLLEMLRDSQRGSRRHRG